MNTNKTDNLINTFEELVSDNYSIIHRYIFCKISDKFEAENIIQETLLLAWLNFSNLKNKNSFKGWIITIASNCCKKYYYKKEKNCIPTEYSSLISLAEKRRLRDTSDYYELSNAIDSLASEQKQVIDDFYFNTLKIKEISFLRNIPTGTVKRRLYDARTNLKKELEKNMSNKFNNILPLKKPEIKLMQLKNKSFDINLNEVPWMYCDIRLGHKITWGIYDAPDWDLTDTGITNTKRKANIHGIECIEIEVKDFSSPKNGVCDQKYNLYVHADNEQIQYVAKASFVNDSYNMISLFDDEFNKNYYIEFPRKIKDYGYNIYDNNDIYKIDFPTDNDSLLIGGGIFKVTIGENSFECLRVIDRWQDSPRIVVENYISKEGRSILFRRYNHPVWKIEKYKERWDEKFPDALTLLINGEKYIHWYDCLSDAVF